MLIGLFIFILSLVATIALVELFITKNVTNKSLKNFIIFLLIILWITTLYSITILTFTSPGYNEKKLISQTELKNFNNYDYLVIDNGIYTYYTTEKETLKDSNGFTKITVDYTNPYKFKPCLKIYKSEVKKNIWYGSSFQDEYEYVFEIPYGSLINN